MENKQHTIICVVGRTSSGKDTLVSRFCEKNVTKQLISYTTRERRTGEGDTHIFVSEDDYNRMKAEGKIAAYTKIGQYRYWSTVDQIYENDLYVIDPIGIKTLKEMQLPDLKIVSVYINVPDELRKERAITKRKDDKNTFLVRDRAEKKEFEEFLKNAEFDYAVQNVRFPEAYSVFKWICTAEGALNNKENEDV